MTLRQVRIFVEVYRTCNITRAAETLYMTQPAVTRSLQEIEQTYDVKLFERLHHRLSPTAAAQRLYAQAVYLLDSFDRMEDSLHHWDEHGILRVGSTVTLGSALLPQLARRFQAEHPGCNLQVQVANGQTITEALCDNRLDMALLENNIPLPELHCEDLGADRLCAVLAADHPLAVYQEITPQQLADTPLLVREPGSTARTLLENAMAEYGLALHPMWESVSTDALIEAAAQRLGISILPEPLASLHVQDERLCLRPIRGVNLTRRRVLVWHKEKFFTPLMQQFADLCRREGRC